MATATTIVVAEIASATKQQYIAATETSASTVPHQQHQHQPQQPQQRIISNSATVTVIPASSAPQLYVNIHEVNSTHC